MSDAGYTLTETLAALAVVGMAIGGLSLGVQVIGPLQLSASKTVTHVQSTRSSQELLEELLAQGAPFSSHAPDDLSGGAEGFRFSCGAPAPCVVQVVVAGKVSRLQIATGHTPSTTVGLPLAGAAHFVYRSVKGSSDVWPPTDSTRQTLRSVALLQATDQGEMAVLDARTWSEQRAACDFDPVMQDCR